MNERSATARDYGRFFRLSADMLCVAGFDGYFKILNPAWEKVIGYSTEELMAEPYLDFVHPDDREPTLVEAGRLVEGEVVVSFDNRYRAKDGSYRWLHWKAVPDMGREQIFAVARDVTAQKLAEIGLTEAKIAAETANRAKSDFLASMSHELRTPLNSVIGFSQVLLTKDGTRSEAEEQVYLERIQANGTHLLALINQVLDLEKVEAGKSEIEYDEVDIAQLVVECVDQFEVAVSKAPVELSVVVEAGDLEGGLEPVWTDRHKLNRVLINLIGNAVKFTEEGSITVKVLSDGESSPAVIEVVDTGIGIPKDKLDRIFERFEQIDSGTSRSFAGTGLGLAICRALCDLLGFELTVSSELGIGSTFRIYLGPPTDEDVSQAPVRDSQAIALQMVRELEAARGRTLFDDRVVLVIDDDEDSLMLLSRSFQELGCQVLTASTGLTGVRMAEEHAPDLITLDLLMPATNGGQVLRLLWGDSRLARIPVVVISTVGSDSSAGIPDDVDILDKPVTMEQIERVLKRNLIPAIGRILLVGGSDAEAGKIAEWLRHEANKIERARDGRETLELIKKMTPDLIIMNHEMSGMGAEELTSKVRRLPHLRELPVLLATDRAMQTRELVRLGRVAAPVLTKGPRFAGDLREICWKTSGQARPASGSAEAIPDES